MEQVVGDGEIMERARLFRDAARRSISEGGASPENFQKFVDLLRERESPCATRSLCSQGIPSFARRCACT